MSHPEFINEGKTVSKAWLACLTSLPGAFFSDEKNQKSFAVLVADRITEAQKPKRKKLAQKTWEMLWSPSVVGVLSLISTHRCSNRFSFLTAFAPPLSDQPAARQISKSQSLAFHAEPLGLSPVYKPNRKTWALFSMLEKPRPMNFDKICFADWLSSLAQGTKRWT